MKATEQSAGCAPLAGAEMSRPRMKLAWLMVAAILILTVIFQWRMIAQLKAANADLVGQLSNVGDVVPAPDRSSEANVDAEELARLRAEHSELMRLRGEVTLLRNQLRELTAKPGAAAPDTKGGAAVEARHAPFSEISTNSIPGRYSCVDIDEQGNVTKSQIIQLNADGSFLTFWRPDGQASSSSAYKWLLHPQGLVLTWQKGISLFHSVAGVGVYVSEKEDKTQLRLQKID